MAERAVRADSLNYPPINLPYTRNQYGVFNDYRGLIYALRRNINDGVTFPTKEQKKELEGFEQFFNENVIPYLQIKLFQDTEQNLTRDLFYWLAEARTSEMQSEVDSIKSEWENADPSMKMRDFLKSVEKPLMKMLDHNEQLKQNYDYSDIFGYTLQYPQPYFPVAKRYDGKGNPYLSFIENSWIDENITVGEGKNYYSDFFNMRDVRIRTMPTLNAILNHMFTAAPQIDEAKAKKEIIEFLKSDSATPSTVFSVSWWLRFFQMNPEIVRVQAKSVGRNPARDYFYKTSSNTFAFKRLTFALGVFETREQIIFKEAKGQYEKWNPEMMKRIDALAKGIQEATNRHHEILSLKELGQAITSYEGFDSHIKLAFYEYVIAAMTHDGQSKNFRINIKGSKGTEGRIIDVANVFNIPISRPEGEDETLILHLYRYGNRIYENMDEKVKQTILYDSPPTASERVKVLGEAYNSGLQTISDVDTQHNARLGAISQEFYRKMSDEKARFEKERSSLVSTNETIKNMMNQI